MKRRVLAYIIIIIASLLTGLIAVRNIKISTDSIVYVLTSQQIIAGKGITVPVIWFEDRIHTTNGAIPMLWQPPLLPLVFAVMGGVSHDNLLPAQVLNLICLISISIFTYLIMDMLLHNGIIALFCGLLVSTSLPLLNVTHHLLSEPLFITFTVAALYFLVVARQSPEGRYIINLYLSSLCAAAAILTRYTGIALIPLFLWEMSLSIIRQKDRIRFRHNFLSAMIPSITILSLFARNYIISGTIRGVNFDQIAHAPDRSYISAFTGTIGMLFSQFQLGNRPIAMISVFTGLLLLYLLLHPGSRKELSDILKSGLDLVILFMIIYTVLISIHMAKESPIFDLRFVSPLVPFLFIISILVILFIGRMLSLKGFYISSRWIVVSLFMIMLAGNGYKTVSNLKEFSYRQDKIDSFTGSCVFRWVKENYKRDTIITTNEPYYLSFFGGYPTMRLPTRRFYSNAYIPEDMESLLPERMSDVGSRLLVLFNDVREKDYGSYLAGLYQRRENNSNFGLLYECPEGVVYELR